MDKKSQFYIREMKLEDLHKVFSLGENLFTAEKWPALYRSWDEYEVIEHFLSDGEFCLIAENEEEKEIGGFVLGSIKQKRKNSWIYGYISWIGVSPQYQNRGIAKKLIKHITDLFIDKGVRIMFADTSPENKKALEFLKKQGFHDETEHIYVSRNLTKLSYYKRKKLKQEK